MSRMIGRSNGRVQQNKRDITQRGSSRKGTNKNDSNRGRHLGFRPIRGSSKRLGAFLFAAPLLGVVLKAKKAEAYLTGGESKDMNLNPAPTKELLNALAVNTTDKGPDAIKKEKVVPVKEKIIAEVGAKPKQENSSAGKTVGITAAILTAVVVIAIIIDKIIKGNRMKKLSKSG